MSNARISKLKVNLDKVPFKKPSKVNDGTNGKILEQAMINQGFPVDQQGTVDLPHGIEIKSRGEETNAAHTIGTMTFDSIINTPWDKTTFKEKLQKQYRVTIKENLEASGEIVDFSHPTIQKHFEEAYEACRAKLKAQGRIIQGQTISAGKYGSLEHKPTPNGNGKSYAWRIPNSGMKRQLRTSEIISTGLFEPLN